MENQNEENDIVNINEPKKRGRPKKYFTQEEKVNAKKRYDVNYHNQKYKDDHEFKKKQRELSRLNYLKKKDKLKNLNNENDHLINSQNKELL